MMSKTKIKYIHEGAYVAEIEVEVIQDDTSWSPYLSVTDALRLDKVREALRNGDLATVATQAKVYRLQPVTAAT